VNSRLDELQAAMLRIKLQHLDDENQHRREIAACYCRNIKHPNIILPAQDSSLIIQDLSHVWHLFVIRHTKREKLQKYLQDRGIQTLIHYPVPPHKQRAYRQWKADAFPVTEHIHEQILSLPIGPDFSGKCIDIIAQCIASYK
jgi:dTDP-4-amino-4,6-dideoxygalactose transaminase